MISEQRGYRRANEEELTLRVRVGVDLICELEIREIVNIHFVFENRDDSKSNDEEIEVRTGLKKGELVSAKANALDLRPKLELRDALNLKIVPDHDLREEVNEDRRNGARTKGGER
jgi:hypothetical protein